MSGESTTMLRLLLDEHIDPAVAGGLERVYPGCVVIPLARWQDRAYLGASDGEVLAAALNAGFTFVTYDQSTIVPLLRNWIGTGKPHPGVLFVPRGKFPQGPRSVGNLIRALRDVLERFENESLINRVLYLER